MLIGIEELQVSVRLGCTPEERAYPQIVRLDIQLLLNDPSSMRSDNLNDTVDYMSVLSAIEKVTAEGEFSLLEHLVYTLGTAILSLSPRLDAVTIAAQKRISPLAKGISFSAEIKR
ncbi:MAG: dihydroneopterin aldolase [Bdellovibrionales bacterium]|nr:dihydroneopterin aldolase [Bdellovibrionales bacterium]